MSGIVGVMLSGRRWAVERPTNHPCAVPSVHWFHTEAERAAWIARNPGRREAVGVRNPLVSEYRNRMEGKE